MNETCLLFFRFATARAPPPLDASDDLMSVSATQQNGYTTMSFTRPIYDNGDSFDIDLTVCRYILWAYGGTVTFTPPAGPTGPHAERGPFSEPLCLPSLETCPGGCCQLN